METCEQCHPKLEQVVRTLLDPAVPLNELPAHLQRFVAPLARDAVAGGAGELIGRLVLAALIDAAQVKRLLAAEAPALVPCGPCAEGPGQLAP